MYTWLFSAVFRLQICVFSTHHRIANKLNPINPFGDTLEIKTLCNWFSCLLCRNRPRVELQLAEAGCTLKCTPEKVRRDISTTMRGKRPRSSALCFRLWPIYQAVLESTTNTPISTSLTPGYGSTHTQQIRLRLQSNKMNHLLKVKEVC